jgi:hypothetical protein
MTRPIAEPQTSDETLETKPATDRNAALGVGVARPQKQKRGHTNLKN